MDIVSAVVKRVNEASGIYQMFGVLVDVISLNRYFGPIHIRGHRVQVIGLMYFQLWFVLAQSAFCLGKMYLV